MVAQQAGNEFFLHRLDDVDFVGAVDEEQHRELAVDLRDVALKNDLGETRSHERLALDVLHELPVGHPDSEFDRIKVPGMELAGAARGKVEVGEVGQDARLFEPVPFPADRADIHAGGFANAVVAFARVADELADDQALLRIEFSWGSHK